MASTRKSTTTTTTPRLGAQATTLLRDLVASRATSEERVILRTPKGNCYVLVAGQPERGYTVATRTVDALCMVRPALLRFYRSDKEGQWYATTPEAQALLDREG